MFSGGLLVLSVHKIWICLVNGHYFEKQQSSQFVQLKEFADDNKPFPKQQILDSFKLKGFADDNFKFNENCSKFSKRVENTVGKGKCSLRAISPFPTVFLKDLYCRHVKTRACLAKG